MSIPPPTQPPPPPQPPSESPRRRPRLIGAAVAVGVLVVAAVIGLNFDQGGLVVPILLVPVGIVGATLAMISRQLRPYATGFLLTMAAALIVLGGTCVVILVGLSNTGA